MNRPNQEDLDTCRDVLEYFIADMTEYEPYAVSTIASMEHALGAVPADVEDVEQR